jgi:hypothetical protein
MEFLTLVNKFDEIIAEIIKFDDGCCVIKYENERFPTIYSSLDILIEELDKEFILIKNGVRETQ